MSGTWQKTEEERTQIYPSAGRVSKSALFPLCSLADQVGSNGSDKLQTFLRDGGHNAPLAGIDIEDGQGCQGLLHEDGQVCLQAEGTDAAIFKKNFRFWGLRKPP